MTALNYIYGASFGLFKSGLLLMIKQCNSYPPLSFYAATSSPRNALLYQLICLLASFFTKDCPSHDYMYGGYFILIPR